MNVLECVEELLCLRDTLPQLLISLGDFAWFSGSNEPFSSSRRMLAAALSIKA